MDFPSYFQSCYSHMILVDDAGDTDDNGYYYLVPPNQLDWHFTLKKHRTKDIWYVHGVREYEVVSMTYIKRDDTWHRKK